MKKLIKIFSCAIMVCLTLSLLTACSELPRAHDHILEKHEAIGSTCIQNGAIEYYTCECGKIFADAEGEIEITEADLVTDKAAHTWGEYLSDGNATCMADGTKTATCQVEGCGATDTVTDEGSQLDHSFVTYVYNNDATCTENGTETATCVTSAGCVETDTRVVENSALGHDFGDTAGCSRCDVVATNEEMIALGYIAKANGVYYKALGTAVEAAGAKTVTVIADSAEDVTLGASSILKIASGVNYTGNVSNYTATVSGDAVAYFASSAKALTSYTTCGKEVTIKLYEDITASKQIAFAKGYVVTLDLNGHTVTSTMTNTYSRLFLTRDNFVLTSSVAGSKIELTTAAGLLQTSSDNKAAIVSVSNVEINQAVNADSELVLNYASLNVEDVVINVTGKKSVFSTYGNLTVGVAEINVTGVLGTSLINNNGAVEVLLDGTTMNVAGFRVNGGAFFSKNQATSFVLNNVNLDLVIDETYTSYLFNRTENVQVIGGYFNVRGENPYAIHADGTWEKLVPTAVTTADELKTALAKGGLVKLGANISYTKQIVMNPGVEAILDLNGYTLTSAVSNTSSRLFLTKGNFTLTSSVAGGKVEMTTGAGLLQPASGYADAVVVVRNVEINQTVAPSTHLILNYANLSLEDVVINAIASKSSSAQLISTYGNLAVNGSEINLSGVLGTSFIGNNGAVAILLNGTTIKVDGFRVNGGAFFSKNQATTVVLNNISLDLVIDETYKSYFFNNNGGVQVIGGNFNVRGAKPYEISANGVWGIAYVKIDNAEDLISNLENGEYVRLTDDVATTASVTAPYGNKCGFIQNGGVLDGNGNAVSVSGSGDTYAIMTKGGTIKNLTVDEGFRGIMLMYPNQDIIVDNVTINGNVGYAINTGEYATVEGVDLIVTNSTICGWTSFAGIASASFTNCEFGQGLYWGATSIFGRVFKPYINTTLTDCSFIEHMNLDLSSLAEGQKVTFVNCTVNGVALTADVMTIPTADEHYDTELFTVDLPSWASSIADCVIFA